ncbi:MAG: hypothetical protein HYZ37_16445 [Candidatus Solibacter usitatus]|nr:hypothetical protein [Candidatus Solibacter usitatus]
MSIQIFLQGSITGACEFLAAPMEGDRSGLERLFAGRSAWVSLLSEVVPRALLNELGLAKILLGSSGGGHFFLVLPREWMPKAEEFLAVCNSDIARLSGGELKLVWGSTENLGDWAVVRRRLRESLATAKGTPLRPTSALPGAMRTESPDAYFQELGSGLLDQQTIGWSPDAPGEIQAGKGKYTWTLGSGPDQILLARHTALSDDGKAAVQAVDLAGRADGCKAWGVLRGDVDSLDVRLRRVQSIEEHVQLSVLYKQFFAGELEGLCSLPEYWRKVTILYSGGDDFAVYGAWDALIQLGRELHRLFRRFSEISLQEFPGAEGKTITMSLALAGDGAELPAVFAEAGEMMERAKCTSRDCFALLGRVLEWRQVNGAAELKDTMVRVMREFGGNTQFLSELAAFYREEVFSPFAVSRKREGALEKPWRLHRRVLRVLPAARDRELERLRSSLIVELTGKNSTEVKLRPAGRVALEWARLLSEA